MNLSKTLAILLVALPSTLGDNVPGVSPPNNMPLTDGGDHSEVRSLTMEQYHSPRREGEPCNGSGNARCHNGLECVAGKCQYHSPRREGEPCHGSGKARCHNGLECVAGKCELAEAVKNLEGSSEGAEADDNGKRIFEPAEVLDADLVAMKEASAARQEGKGKGPSEVTFTTKGSKPDFKDRGEGFPSADGELDDPEIGSLSSVKTIKLQGLRQKPNQPVVFKQVDVDHVPVPSFWDENGEQPAETWHGRGTGQFKDASATFIAAADGSIYGSITDGTQSYKVKTSRNGDGTSKKFFFNVVNLEDLPTEEDENEQGSNNSTRRLLAPPDLEMGMLRGVHKKITNADFDKLEGERDLQQCNDLLGLDGKWHDSDGSYYDCAWYAEGTRCSIYGSGYVNFGYTANQACCACGGGRITVVDLLVAYTSAAMLGEGGFDAMMNLINLSVYQTNIALSRSRTGVFVRLVETALFSGVVEPAVEYYADGTVKRAEGVLLDKMKDSTDLMGLRENVGADLVALIVKQQSNLVGRASNVGSKLGGSNLGLSVTGHIVADQEGQHTFAHELGHNMKACHFGDTWNCDNVGQGYGDCTNCFRTVMAYPASSVCGATSCSTFKRELYFSNTEVTLDGHALGDSTHNNAATIKSFASTIAAVKPTKAVGVKFCKLNPCEANPYFVPLNDGKINMPQVPDEIGHDVVSLIVLPLGYAAEWCLDSNYAGGCWYGFRPSDGRWGSQIVLSDYHNNKLSSFRVRKVDGLVRLYKHYERTGEYYDAVTGEWPWMPAEIGNDQLSTVYLPRGYKITVYKHGNFDTSLGTYSYDRNVNLNMCSSCGHDNQVSSFKIEIDFSV